jgi:hypothetical protein
MLLEEYTGGEGEETVDGHMSTGDLGHLDEEGRLFVEGRADDMIVSGGENVYPEEVEQALERHERVSEAAVLGVKDEEFGERLKAVVVSEGQVSEDDLKSHVKDNLAKYKVPREIEFVDELPRTPQGKVDKQKLAEDEPEEGTTSQLWPRCRVERGDEPSYQRGRRRGPAEAGSAARIRRCRRPPAQDACLGRSYHGRTHRAVARCPVGRGARPWPAARHRPSSCGVAGEERCRAGGRTSRADGKPPRGSRRQRAPEVARGRDVALRRLALVAGWERRRHVVGCGPARRRLGRSRRERSLGATA